MKNPYFELHKEFKSAGANVLMSSGQACVLFGIATFSKDGDWIVEEKEDSCKKVLHVLSKKKAGYRLGVPLDIRWLAKEWTSHFEYFLDDGFRMRVDFCSRPPRVHDISSLWLNAGTKKDIHIVDIESLIALKQTRRIRDYNIIGTLAEVSGFNQGQKEIALNYLQDYELLKKAVEKWPESAKKCNRKAVQTIVNGKPRRETIIALAIEQDKKIQSDEERITQKKEKSKEYQKRFFLLSKKWKSSNVPLLNQHDELINEALDYLK